MLSKGSKITGSGAAVAFICFFLPWVLVSCEDQSVMMLSGWDAATGGNVQTTFGPQLIDGSPILFIVLLAAAGCLALVYFVYRRQIAIRSSAYAALGLAGISLLILIVKALTPQTAIPQNDMVNMNFDIKLNFQYGFWGTVLAFLAIIGGAIMDLTQKEQEVPEGQKEPVGQQVP